MKLCSSCNQRRRWRNRSYCRACRNMHEGFYRRPSSEMSLEQKRRRRARAIAGALHRRGLLKALPCEICHTTVIQKHHPDYSKAAIVRWLCHPCHLLEHGEITVDRWHQLAGTSPDNLPESTETLTWDALPLTIAALERLEAARGNETKAAA